MTPDRPAQAPPDPGPPRWLIALGVVVVLLVILMLLLLHLAGAVGPRAH